MHARDWSLLGEGNANIVVEYVGGSGVYANKVLRLAKQTRQDPALLEGYKKAIAQHLFGPELLPCSELVAVSRRFLQDLAEQIRPDRDPARLHKDLCLGATTGVLMDNLAKPLVAVEIKLTLQPKWGFSPYPKSCRFCLHSRLRADGPSHYCPLLLFSKNLPEIQQSIAALVETPRNNLRVFERGSRVYPDSLATAHVLKALPQVLLSSGVLDQIQKRQIEFHDDVAELAKLAQAFSSDDIDDYVLGNIGAILTEQTSSDPRWRIGRFLVSLTLKDLSLMRRTKPALHQWSR
ncbi:hypothetical protein HDV03_001881 [Kappamyces sp. JEL0829]|nr:hypothetical protein HDV03_001881 [Kappamyces sp. JEL0829]